MEIIIRTTKITDIIYIDTILNEMSESAKVRGTGIAKRSSEYIHRKIIEGNSVIAFVDNEWAGFCYLEEWSDKQYVANSGLIVNPIFRNLGIAKKIKTKIFKLSRKLYPDSKIFGLTTSQAVMNINSGLGYKPVIYSELTQDENFWAGCKSCVNYEILISKEKKNCLCTAMIYKPNKQKNI
jgi:hypothetical protein